MMKITNLELISLSVDRTQDTRTGRRSQVYDSNFSAAGFPRFTLFTALFVV